MVNKKEKGKKTFLTVFSRKSDIEDQKKFAINQLAKCISCLEDRIENIEKLFGTYNKKKRVIEVIEKYIIDEVTEDLNRKFNVRELEDQITKRIVDEDLKKAGGKK